MSALPHPSENHPEEKSTERFNLRATPSEAALVRQAAYARHQSVTEFMLGASVEAARQVLAEDHTITVPGEVYERLQKELAAPGTPIEALVNLLGQPRRLAKACRSRGSFLGPMKWTGSTAAMTTSRSG